MGMFYKAVGLFKIARNVFKEVGLLKMARNV